MKRLFACLIIGLLLLQDVSAQEKPIRKRSIGVSFVMNDFVTPQRIRSSSLANVMRENRWAKFKEMSPGIAVTYFKGVSPYVDFTTTLGASFANLPLPGKSFDKDHLFVAADAAGHFKMLPENYRFTPYLIAGVGATQYRGIYGAIVPLGGGVKTRLFNETQAFVQLQYRVPVTPESVNYHFQASLGFSGLLGKN